MFGGLGEHVVALTRQQVLLGHEVVVITQQSEPAVSGDEIIEGVRVIRVHNEYPSVPFNQDHLDQWAHGFALASNAAADRLAHDWIPDISHAHDWLGATQAHVFAVRHHVPLVVTFHATEFGRHQGWLASRISRVIHAREITAARYASRIVVCSSYMQGELVNGLGVNQRKIRIVANGVSRASIGTSGQIPQDDSVNSTFVIGFLGRLEWEKGVHHVIDSLKFLPTSDFRVEIIGSGSQLRSLQEKVDRNNLTDRVRFHGFVTAQEKQELLSNFDVLVVPSSYEPFGIVALEGAARGIPLIIGRTGGLVDIVPDDSFGYPLDDINGSKIAQQVQLIVEDAVEARKRSARLLDRLQTEFTWEVIARSTDLVYSEALDASVG